MHTRRLLCSILGMWLAANIIISVSASTNLRMADTTLASPDAPLAKIIKQWGYGTVRQVMRHEAGEVNRYLFAIWGWVSIFFALVVLGMLFSVKAGPAHFAAGGLALLMTLAMQFLLTPEIAGIGRMLDFVPDNAMMAERSRFASMHRVYAVSQWLVMLPSAGLLAVYIRRNRSRRLSVKPVNQINAVDDADDAHIDG